MTDKKTIRTLPLSLLALGLILIAVSGYSILRNASAPSDLSAVPVQVNYAAPELTLTDIRGVSRSLSDYRGKVTLVNLWATWCPPCKEEMPALQTYYEKHKEEGFTIIAINDGETAADVIRFVNDYQLTFPVWLDATYIATEQAFKTLNLPSSFVIDRHGTIRLRWIGAVDGKTLEKYVTPIIKEKQ